MKQDIRQRIAALRKWMEQHAVDAFIVPTNDPHNSEYVAEHWEARRWLTGFTGSAGTAVVTRKQAALWTDSRYFLQAADQLKGSGIVLMKERLPETPSIGRWLGKQLGEKPCVAIDGWLDNGAYGDDLMQHLGVKPTYLGDPFEEIWADRPALPQAPVFIHASEYAGESVQQKLARVRAYVRDEQKGCKGILLSALDDIAWTLNLRGSDVHCNPVFIAYLYVSARACTLYIIKEKLDETVEAYLRENGIAVKPYARIETDMRREKRPVVACSTLNGQLKAALQQPRYVSPSPVALMKCVKNEVEQAGFRRTMETDGVAMVKFLKWLKPAVQAGGETELSIDRKLCALRAEGKEYQGISFDTIAGYGEHAAIVHYEATPETDIPLRPQGLLLLDSGGQYLGGTTDLTRTIALGPTTAEEKRDYTLVLKGFLHLQHTQFPAGTCGTQLDIMARQFMWKEGVNYLHGTGHGVGTFLCVHEGPHQIRMNHVPTPLRPGMVVTDEPGIYKAGSHGIRTENTLLVVPAQETEFGAFYQFEPLTLCPIDKEAIDLGMMTSEEIGWFNQYHEMVYNRLAPLLDDEHRAWLREATSELKVEN